MRNAFAMSAAGLAALLPLLSPSPAAAAYERFRVYDYQGSAGAVVIGRVIFNSGGATESVQACDDEVDGVSIEAIAVIPGRQYIIRDPSHGAPQCGEPVRFDVPEGGRITILVLRNGQIVQTQEVRA